MKEKLKFGVLVLMLLFIKHLSAQEAMISAGGNASGINASTSYSIGQIVYTLCLGENGSINQGVQNQYEISVFTDIIDPDNTKIQCVIFPNPTSSIIKLTVSDLPFDNIRYALYDIQGKIQRNNNIIKPEEILNLSELATGVYFLKIYSKDVEIKSFKIIKK